jgi:hypothetical protein
VRHDRQRIARLDTGADVARRSKVRQATTTIYAVLGNDLAIKAYREAKLPYPDGSIIARLAWGHTPSEENDKVFGREQSFVAGSPIHVQFMVKDSRKYPVTGGWGFAQSTDGKPADDEPLRRARS